MLIYRADLKFTKPTEVRVREWRVALRKTFLEAGQWFHATYVKGGKRFTLAAAQQLRYAARSSKYELWKRKAADKGRRYVRNGVRYRIKDGGAVPNVLTGVFRQAMELARFRGFPTRVRIEYPLMPHWAKRKPDLRKVRRPWPGNEATRVSSDEAAMFAAFVKSRLPVNVRAAMAANTKRKR